MRKLALILCLFVMAPLAFGHGGSHDECETYLFGSSQTSERQLEEAKRLMAEVVAAAKERGYEIPENIVKFVTATDMAGIAVLGGHAFAHPEIGFRILQTLEMASGIYEVVFDGQNAKHQFVRDTNRAFENADIFMHVIGHMDFFLQSNLYKVRKADPIEASAEFAEMVSRYKGQYGNTAVDAFVQLLLSLDMLQDVTRGSFESPESFDTSRGGSVRPTYSVLQALVHNLPAEVPAWQKHLLEIYERRHRTVGAAVQTKIANEGWAMMTQYTVTPGTSLRTMDDIVSLAQFRGGVRARNPKAPFSNPYWAGSEGWIRVRERFLEQPEIKALAPIEQERRWKQHANDIIAVHNDYTFLRMALDETWVRRHNIVLHRPAGDGKNMVITRDPKRIIDWIANQEANRELQLPRVKLVSFGADGLKLEHEVVNGVPLEPQSATQMLYVLAKLVRMPVSITTQASKHWYNDNTDEGDPVTVTVSPDGSSDVASPSSRVVNELKSLARTTVRALDYDHWLSFGDLGVSPSPVLQKLQDHFTSRQAVNASINLSSNAPYAAQAVVEFNRAAAGRVEKQLRLMAKGQMPVRFGDDGSTVQVQVLPLVPEFKLDLAVAEANKAALPATEPDSVSNPPWIQPSMMVDQDLDIGTGRYLPGDVYKGEKQGEGDGDGEGQPQDGQKQKGKPKQGKGKGAKPGEGNSENNPRFVEIPIEFFAEILAEEIQLRNLRRTESGETEVEDESPEGQLRRPEGMLHIPATAKRIYARGLARARQLERQGKKVNRSYLNILRLGLQNMQRDDRVVYDMQPTPVPDTDAVIVWARDMSGSISDKHRKVITQFSANVRALLKTKHPRLKERFVIFNESAKEVTAEEFFTVVSSGGTTVATGLTLMREILETYPRPRFNRYAVLFTDGDDGGGDAVNRSIDEMDKIRQMNEHFAYAHINPDSPNHNAESSYTLSSLSKKAKELAATDKDRIGWAFLNDSFQSVIDALKEFYGKR